MNKKEVQKRILQNGNLLALSKFSWDEKTKTFSSAESDLVIDFLKISDCTFATGSRCTFKTGGGCMFTTGSCCTFTTGSYCTFKTGSGCMFTTGSCCTFTTWDDCTFPTGSHCTFKIGSGCMFTTGDDCSFATGSHCTFKTGSYCTFKTWYNCTFKTWGDCVALRRGNFLTLKLKKNEIVTFPPFSVPGFVKNGIYSETGRPAIIADGILSEVISKKVTKIGTIYRVINYRKTETTYLIEVDGIFSHGDTLKEAKESLKYKISSRDLSAYNNLTLDSVLTQVQAIKLYRAVTGACEQGTRYFVENLKNPPKKLTVKKLIELTKGQYEHGKLMEFFKK